MRRVVIVDDAPFVREVLTHILRSARYEVVGEASDGIEAVEIALRTKPELIIMDIVMPRKSGIEASQEILKLLPDVKIVACSTEGSETMVTRAIEAGCIDYIVKPFEQKSLLATLDAVFVQIKSDQRSQG